MRKLLWILVLIFTVFSSGCNKNDLDIERGYDFNITMRELPFKIQKYSSVNVRLRINRDGIFAGTKYKMSFVQYAGTGTLQDKDGNLLAPNILHDLSADIFELKYTSYSDVEHYLEITITDNFGRLKMQKVKLLNDDSVDMVK